MYKVGFVWSVQDQQWDSNFEALRRHKAETGGFHVSIKQNRKLSTFISRLRTAMSHKEQGLVQQECEYTIQYIYICTTVAVHFPFMSPSLN